MGLGFYSSDRASTSVASQYLSASEIGIRATAHYHGNRPRQDELRTESVLVDFGRDPLRIRTMGRCQRKYCASKFQS